ncbi:hypothetical protein Tco_0409006 [Tanacetum coccineum]
MLPPLPQPTGGDVILVTESMVGDEDLGVVVVAWWLGKATTTGRQEAECSSSPTSSPYPHPPYSISIIAILFLLNVLLIVSVHLLRPQIRSIGSSLRVIIFILLRICSDQDSGTSSGECAIVRHPQHLAGPPQTISSSAALTWT